MLTAVLTRADVARHLSALILLDELRSAFRAPLGSSPGRSTFRQGELEALPAWSATVRSDTATGRRAVLQLHDRATGHLLAVMDAVHLSTLRASLVGALAADVLARPDAKTVAILGAGAAASSALKALRLVRSIEQVWFHQPDVAENFELAHRLQRDLSMAIRAADTVDEAVSGADLVVVVGNAPVELQRLRVGTHVSLLDALAPFPSPLGPNLLEQSRRFCDAEPSSALSGAPFTPLYQVLGGGAPGRTHAKDVTVFASLAPPSLDALTAWHVYEGARHDETLTRIDLEA